jgi:hypothetical protein
MEREGHKAYKGMGHLFGGDPRWLVLKTLKYRGNSCNGTLKHELNQVHESKTHRVGIGRLHTLEGPRTQESIDRLWRVTPKQDVNGLGSGFNTVHLWYLLSGVDLLVNKA